MATKPGDRIEFGSEIEPCGGAVTSVKGETVVVHWDNGGTSLMSATLLNLLSCGRVLNYDADSGLVG